jgi:hypothetical protein
VWEGRRSRSSKAISMWCSDGQPTHSRDEAWAERCYVTAESGFAPNAERERHVLPDNWLYPRTFSTDLNMLSCKMLKEVPLLCLQ